MAGKKGSPQAGQGETVRARARRRPAAETEAEALARSVAELRQSREDFSRAQAVGQIGSWRLDVGRNVLTWSDENHRIFGIAPGTPLTYETFLQTVHPDDRAMVDTRWKAALAGEPYEIEHRIVVAGRVRWVREKAFLEFGPRGALLGGFGITQDITDRKLAEQQLHDLNESLERRVAERTAEALRQADQVRSLSRQLLQAEQRERKRLARILHDHIQQLLVGARIRLELLTRETAIKRVRAAAQGVDTVLREALEASRSLAVDLSPPVLRQAGLVGSLGWLGARMGEVNQFLVTLRADPKAEPESEEVRLVLFECARELLLNAVKHSGVAEAHVALHRTRDGLVEVIVRDAGRGFDPEALARHAPTDLTLGLAGIRERVAQLGGAMEVATAPGQGTRVTVTVPGDATGAADAGDALRELADHASAGRVWVRRSGAPCRVLIVDDHKIMREGLRGLLEFERDIDVVGEASDGAGAVELAGKLAPDVVVMDVNLEGMSGLEATRRIVSEHPRVKVVGLSMDTEPDLLAAMTAAGAAACLTKAGPVEDLVAALRACAPAGPPAGTAAG